METLELQQFAENLKPRPREFHKGDAGHVLMVGGDYGYSGAVRLAAEAALRVGAGLVSVVTRPENAWVLNVARPEIMCHADTELKILLEKANLIAVGPGLGRTSWGRKLLTIALKSDKPLIVDADGLNLLADMHLKQENWILTPHPGEAARLLKKTVSDIQLDRANSIAELKKKLGGVCVLKGAGTLVITSDSKLYKCEMGNPGMATGGTGDVLTGVIAGLVAQHMSLDNAAKLGVLVHALAGDLAAKGGERGMIASDMMAYLREIMNYQL